MMLKKSNYNKAFTLIEIMVVIAIISILSLTSFMGLSTILDSDIYSIGRKFSSNIKFLFDHAALNGAYIKIEFDFEKNSYKASASRDRFLLFSKKRSVQGGEVEEDEKFKKRKEAIEEEEEKAENASSSLMNSELEIDAIQAVKRFKEAKFDSIIADDDLNFEIELPESVKIAGVYTEYYDNYVTENKAELFIFPNGYIQRAAIVFSDKDEEEFLTILIDPYTAKVEIRDEFYNLDEEPELEDDDD